LSLTSTKAETVYPDVANFPSSATYPMVGIMPYWAKGKEMGKEVLSKYNPMELILAWKSTEGYAFCYSNTLRQSQSVLWHTSGSLGSLNILAEAIHSQNFP
jgi:hypothetical protein